MPGINFDRAASFYDATRALPDGVAEDVRDALRRHVGATAHTRFLEVGIGTGRIALPFLRAGDAYHGVDLSASMVQALRAKLDTGGGSRARGAVVLADSMDLPFRAGVFDVVLMIHVLHLVDDHGRALGEARRVLRSGGRLVVSANEFAAADRRGAVDGRLPGARRLVADRWDAILTDLGVERTRANARRWLRDESMTELLEALGASVERVVLARYHERSRTAREAVIAYRDRVFSSDWEIPDELHAEATRRLLSWLEREHPAPDDPSSVEGAFSVLVATFP